MFHLEEICDSCYHGGQGLFDLVDQRAFHHDSELWQAMKQCGRSAVVAVADAARQSDENLLSLPQVLICSFCPISGASPNN